MLGRVRTIYRQSMPDVRRISVPACLCAVAYGLLIRPRQLKKRAERYFEAAVDGRVNDAPVLATAG
jgi:hypothetical protein